MKNKNSKFLWILLAVAVVAFCGYSFLTSDLEHIEDTNGPDNYALTTITDENIINRMSGRRACLACGATYHIVHIPTKVEGICDRCGQELVLRDDDKPETVSNRLKVYHDQTQPLIDFYTKKGVLKSVDGTVDMMDVFAAIKAILAYFSLV